MHFLDWLCRPFASRAINPVMKDDHAQHFRELNDFLGVLNRVRHAPDERKEQHEHLKVMLRQMIDDLAQHFRRELELMQCYGYHRKDIHQREHSTMIQTLERYHGEVESGTRVVDESLINGLKDWLVAHMKTEDRKLNAFLSKARPVGKLGKLASS